jgi:tetratricopeptide (TPR) repeat protein
VGRASGQRGFQDPREVLGDWLREGSLYRLLADHGQAMFGDEYFANLYSGSVWGQPTVPARIVATVMVLQAFEGLSARSFSDRSGEADALIHLGVVQRLTGDYPAATASQQQALALCRDLGNRQGQAEALNCLGVVQQEEGDYPAAAASQHQALALFRDLGNRLGQAEALNGLGELSSRTFATSQAREYHAQALAIARDLRAPLEEARALEGLGQAHLQDGNSRRAAAQLRHAFTIYQRLGAPARQRVQEALQDCGLTQPAAPTSEGHQQHAPS